MLRAATLSESTTVERAGNMLAGAFIKVIASAPSGGERFAGWTGDTAILDNPQMPVATVTMPSMDVTITATYEGGEEKQ